MTIERSYATLVINSNWYLVPFWSYRELLFKFWTLRFRAPPPWGLSVSRYYSS